MVEFVSITYIVFGCLIGVFGTLIFSGYTDRVATAFEASKSIRTIARENADIHAKLKELRKQNELLKRENELLKATIKKMETELSNKVSTLEMRIKQLEN